MRQLRHITLAAAVAVVAIVLAGCGEKKETLGDTTAIYGPGVRATPPPWPPEYAHLAQRIKQLKLPPIDKEQFHSHALMHIYNDGRLIEIPPNIGLDRSHKVFSSIHTHDPLGIIHMESKVPFKFTIGDFFTIWGVRFGSKSLGSLQNEGDKQVRVYVNGKSLPNPVDYVMRDKDNISIGYGTDDSFPHTPSAEALKTVAKGGKGTCTAGGTNGKKRKSCIDTGGN